tara:strand:+ start:114 stop:302 length:189 start_codon:yes stop_codon:yes gene_type:complete
LKLLLQDHLPLHKLGVVLLLLLHLLHLRHLLYQVLHQDHLHYHQVVLEEDLQEVYYQLLKHH